MKTKTECEKEKEEFYNLLVHWLEHKDKASWDRMFIIINDICISLMKKKANGIVLPDLESKALDAAIYSMDLIRRGKYPDIEKKFLYGWLNSQIIGTLYSQKQQRIDREISLEQYIEEYGKECLDCIDSIYEI